MLSVGLVGGRSSMQPELFGLLFLVGFFFLRDRLVLVIGQKGARARWWLAIYVLFFALWANIHSSFFFGLMVLGLQAASRCLEGIISAYRSWDWSLEARRAWIKIRPLMMLMLLGAAAALLNPFGFGVYYLIFWVMQNINFLQMTIQEWGPTEFVRSGAIFWSYFSVSLALMSAASLLRKRLMLEGFLFLIFCGHMVFEHTRNVAVFGVATMPYFLEAWSHCRRLAPLWFKTLAALSISAVACFFFWLAAASAEHNIRIIRAKPKLNRDYINASMFPVLAFEFVERYEADLPKRIMSDWGWGGYVDWRLADNGFKVFFDGRYLFHSLMEEGMKYTDRPQAWSGFLKSRGVDLVIRSLPQTGDYMPSEAWDADASQERLLRSKTAVFYSPQEWALIWWDALSVVLVRRSAVSPHFLARREYQFWAPLDFEAVHFGLKTGRIDARGLEREMRRNYDEAGSNFINSYFFDELTRALSKQKM